MAELHGGNLRRISDLYEMDPAQLCDFSANINPLGMPIEFKKIINESIAQLEQYPDYQYLNLKETLANFHRLNSDMIHVGNGAAEIIEDLMKVLPQSIITVQPTFSEYDLAANKYGKKVQHYYLTEDQNFRLNGENFCQWLGSQYEKQPQASKLSDYQAAVFICNPNNPTGLLIKRQTLIEMVRFLNDRRLLLVVDESFMEFIESDHEYEMLSACQDWDNLVVIRSLTKFYAIPGLRLGYTLSANRSLIQYLTLGQVTWSINTLAMNCGLAIPDLGTFRRSTWDFMQVEREWFYQELQKFMDLRVFEPSVNYVFFQCDHQDFYQEVLKQGMVIRDCANYPGLGKGYYRMAVRTHQEDIRMLQALGKVLGE